MKKEMIIVAGFLAATLWLWHIVLTTPIAAPRTVRRADTIANHGSGCCVVCAFCRDCDLTQLNKSDGTPELAMFAVRLNCSGTYIWVDVPKSQYTRYKKAWKERNMRELQYCFDVRYYAENTSKYTK